MTLIPTFQSNMLLAHSADRIKFEWILHCTREDVYPLYRPFARTVPSSYSVAPIGHNPCNISVQSIYFLSQITSSSDWIEFIYADDAGITSFIWRDWPYKTTLSEMLLFYCYC